MQLRIGEVTEVKCQKSVRSAEWVQQQILFHKMPQPNTVDMFYGHTFVHELQ